MMLKTTSWLLDSIETSEFFAGLKIKEEILG